MPHTLPENGRKILLVEDEPGVASFISRSLNEQGYEVSIAPDGDTGLSMAMQHEFAMCILDVMLPGINGLELCRRLRGSGYSGTILMLTALGTTENIVTGLDAGADDYLTKPFNLAELRARVRSLLRRQFQVADAKAPESLSIADLSLNLDEKTAIRNGTLVELTATEYRLLEYLIRNQRRVLSRMDILEQVWGIDFNMNTKVVDVYINYLRKKIDKDYEPKLIHTAIGMGYIMKEGDMHENTD